MKEATYIYAEDNGKFLGKAKPENIKTSYKIDSTVKSDALSKPSNSIARTLEQLAVKSIKHVIKTSKSIPIRNEVPPDISAINISGMFGVYRPLDNQELHEFQRLVNLNYTVVVDEVYP